MVYRHKDPTNHVSGVLLILDLGSRMLDPHGYGVFWAPSKESYLGALEGILLGGLTNVPCLKILSGGLSLPRVL